MTRRREFCAVARGKKTIERSGPRPESRSVVRGERKLPVNLVPRRERGRTECWPVPFRLLTRAGVSGRRVTLLAGGFGAKEVLKWVHLEGALSNSTHLGSRLRTKCALAHRACASQGGLLASHPCASALTFYPDLTPAASAFHRLAAPSTFFPSSTLPLVSSYE